MTGCEDSNRQHPIGKTSNNPRLREQGNLLLSLLFLVLAQLWCSSPGPKACKQLKRFGMRVLSKKSRGGILLALVD